MLEVLEHLKDDAGALAQIHGLMCEGGVLVLSVPNRHPLHLLNPIMYLQHERHYSNAGLVELLERSGFAVRHFNVVEDWRLLANLYLHLVRKFGLRRTGQFEVFTRRGNRTYSRLNRRGLDIVVQAVRL
jgi:SAM-dependent methyltransferase